MTVSVDQDGRIGWTAVPGSVLMQCMMNRNYWSLAAFTFLVWEYLITLPYEYWYIWKRPMTHIKFMYLFSRYFGLIALGANFILLSRQLSHPPVPFAACKSWYIYQIIAFWLLFSTAEAVLMLRGVCYCNKTVSWPLSTHI
ncbi:hypothetical protein BDQ12DRAFT_141081 [Crucibulum laeve]|uniref:DUF6533 domain-containing protein n=1 Tax=Crucibulum laeve TaxID=68775 RepID=A0A5C3M0L5_9AGAR|nr:hypothetical protein BDQ12DRAFT_141081 [Crucibulum laeve]